MGYADYLTFDAEDLDRYWAERRSTGITCRRCGESHLQWKEVRGGEYRLVDESRGLHTCQPAKNKGA